MFFFQAEDGIRDVAVTGVQTCALPISLDRGRRRPRGYAAARAGRTGVGRSGVAAVALLFVPGVQELSQSYLAYWSAPRKCSDTYGSVRSEEHTSELQSRLHTACRLLPRKKKSPGRAPRTRSSCPST